MCQSGGRRSLTSGTRVAETAREGSAKKKRGDNEERTVGNGRERYRSFPEPWNR